jgi:hypothetical protein
MSDRIIQGFSEMKNIYLTQILTEEKEEEDYGEKFEKKYKKTGKKSKDYDGDGEVEDEADEYAGVKDKAIKGATEDDDEDEDEKPKSKKGKKKEKEDDDDMKTEAFSNWRTDLYEVISKLEPEPKVKNIGNEQIAEKPVNNKITLNPTVTEKFAVIDTQELSEEFIVETSNVAAEYFVSQGLNEHGLELVVDYLGEEKFLEYVFYVAEDNLLTEATKSKRTPAELKALEAKRKALNAESKKKHEEAKESIAKKVTVDKGDEAVKKATAEQPKTRTKTQVTKDNIARGILGFISGAQKQYQQGMERHRAATSSAAEKAKTAAKIASQTAKTGSRVASAVGRGAKEIGGGVSSGFRLATGLETAKGKETKLGRNVAAAATRGARTATRTARDVAVRQVARTRVELEKKRQTNESLQYIMEKAVSEQQQKIFGLALSVKRGEVSRSKVSDRVLEIVDGMSESEIRKFASTKHKGIPHKKEE